MAAGEAKGEAAALPAGRLGWLYPGTCCRHTHQGGPGGTGERKTRLGVPREVLCTPVTAWIHAE